MRGLDSPEESFVDEEMERVVDGLTGDGAKRCAHGAGDVIGGGVRMIRDGAEDGESLGCDVELVALQQVSWISTHDIVITQNLD